MVSTFSGKPLFGYRSMVVATMAICLLSFMVWLHHFFTMGAGADVNAIFGIASMIIAVPTGVKIFNWLFTMYGGRIVFTTPMLWSLGFMVTFVIGGMTGVLLAVPPADFVLHNSLFLVAHFHNVIIGGVLFGAFAGYTYWFPKAFGFRLHERLGKAAFWLLVRRLLPGVHAALCAGPDGHDAAHAALRRAPSGVPGCWSRPAGAVVILVGIGLQVAQLVVSIRQREQLARRDRRSLERALARMGDRLAAARVQFRRAAAGAGEDAYWGIKQRARPAGELPTSRIIRDIEMPRNSPTGFVCAFFATVMGFALIWHIWWMVGVGVVGAYATFVVFAWRDRGRVCHPGRGGRPHRSREPRARRAALAREGRRMSGAAGGAPIRDRRGRARRAGAAPGGGARGADLRRSASSSATASGYSCSATS